MPRKARKTPTTQPDPLDIYSTWDVRLARIFYFWIIIASSITVLGIWGTIIGFLVETGVWQVILGWPVGYIIALFAGIITAHLLILVLFFTMFRGGIVRMCGLLYKNRLVAKKYEDFSTLRWLMGITLLGIYITIIGLIIGVLPTIFWTEISKLWLEMVANFDAGNWILYIGLVLFAIIGFFFFMFYLWNHGVYFVLRRVRRIEEEMEVDEQIRKELLQKADEETLMEEYRKETGKVPMYRGRETRGFKAWKKKYGVK